MDKRLYRSEDKGQVAGVAAGLADYFGVDVTLVRIAFVIATLAGGPGLLVYIAMWFVVPEENEINKVKNDGIDF